MANGAVYALGLYILRPLLALLYWGGKAQNCAVRDGKRIG